MPWQPQQIIRSGQYIWARGIDGVWIDPFGSVSGEALLARVRDYANGWNPLSIDLQHGLFSLTGHTYFFGKATREISSEEVAAQIRTACDSFIEIAATDFSISVSDTLDAPDPAKTSEWAITLQLVAVAAIAIAVVYGIKQVREIAD